MLFLGNDRKRRAFRLGQQSGPRLTHGTVEQLQDQLEAVQAQRAFDCEEYEKQIALLLHDQAQLRYELAREKAKLALVLAPSPSETTH